MVDWDIARRMVEKVVEVARPRRVIVFGSLARGETGPDSDIDLLVVMPFVGSRRAQAGRILRALAQFDAPKDVIVVTPEEFERLHDVAGSLVYPAVREGRVLHAA
jgi:predicted nucleotidyltransferase